MIPSLSLPLQERLEKYKTLLESGVSLYYRGKFPTRTLREDVEVGSGHSFSDFDPTSQVWLETDLKRESVSYSQTCEEADHHEFTIWKGTRVCVECTLQLYLDYGVLVKDQYRRGFIYRGWEESGVCATPDLNKTEDYVSSQGCLVVFTGNPVELEIYDGDYVVPDCEVELYFTSDEFEVVQKIYQEKN